MADFVKVETDEETRWINLSTVARATLARHASGKAEILAVYFTSAVEECTLKIDGISTKNAAAIKAIIAALDNAD